MVLGCDYMYISHLLSCVFSVSTSIFTSKCLSKRQDQDVNEPNDLNLNLLQFSQRERKDYKILMLLVPLLPMISRASHKWKTPVSLSSIPS